MPCCTKALLPSLPLVFRVASQFLWFFIFVLPSTINMWTCPRFIVYNVVLFLWVIALFILLPFTTSYHLFGIFKLYVINKIGRECGRTQIRFQKCVYWYNYWRTKIKNHKNWDATLKTSGSEGNNAFVQHGMPTLLQSETWYSTPVQ
jgi:hypothetical protein